MDGLCVHRSEIIGHSVAGWIEPILKGSKGARASHYCKQLVEKGGFLVEKVTKNKQKKKNELLDVRWQA